jgi:hypothetical protein
VQAAFSYGIDTEDNWGCDVSRQLAVPIHQYDCFTPHRPTCDGGRFVFHDECVGAKAETVAGHRFDTIASQIARHGDSNGAWLVKIDIEGAEWDSLMATSDVVLDRIVQMPMELHGTDQRKFLEVVRRLRRQFYLVNLHFNNFSCSPEAAPLPGLAYQVLWVNKRIGELDPNGAVTRADKPAQRAGRTESSRLPAVTERGTIARCVSTESRRETNPVILPREYETTPLADRWPRGSCSLLECAS